MWEQERQRQRDLDFLRLALSGPKRILKNIEKYWAFTCIFCLIIISFLMCYISLNLNNYLESPWLLTCRCLSHHSAWIVCINISQLWQFFDLFRDLESFYCFCFYYLKWEENVFAWISLTNQNLASFTYIHLSFGFVKHLIFFFFQENKYEILLSYFLLY